MTRDLFYAVTALFSTPDAAMHAAGEVRKAGYTRFDVHTPYPVHGMDGAMGLRQSRIGYFAFVFGLMGAATAIGLISWVTLVDYPLVIGGKPFWSWPAFVPVSFELTVLLASVLSTITMIVLYFRFPNNSHPLHDTAYMKRVSADRFGITVEAGDPIFDEKKVTALLSSLGGTDVTPVYFDEAALERPKPLDGKFLAVLAVTALTGVGAVYVTLNILLYMEPFNWMSVQSKLKPQQTSQIFSDGKGMRTPVAGTVARGFMPYAFPGQPDSAGKYLVNPLAPSATVLALGKEKYLTFCSPCHGNFARGDSRLRGQFPNPPTLHSDKVRGWPDGTIYHVISEGQNVMPGYASQIPREERWAVIHYLRVLQRAQNAREADLR
jgi:mono/diheme cytochrome c family protein